MDYIETFKNLKTNNKYSRKSPHKAVLLLAIIDMYENNVLLDNELFYDDTLKSTFLKVWNKVLPEEATFLPEVYFPFWYMQNDKFWHIVPKAGKEEDLKLLRDNHIKPTESKIYDCVKYAELDEDLYFMMTIPSGRTALRRVLLETYTSLSPNMIEKMASSTDNSIDNSIIAMKEYEKILNSSDKKKSNTTTKADSEPKDLFLTLSEDIQITLNLEYFTFLKNHKQERELFKEVFPSVYDLYYCISVTPIKQEDLSPSLSVVYDNFLSDLKITLMSEDGSMELIDQINAALDELRGVSSINPIVIKEEPLDSYDKPNGQNISVKPITTDDERDSLRPAFESRNDMPWTLDEEQKISIYYELGYSIEKISSAIGRTEISIKAKLAALGFINNAYGKDNGQKIDSFKETESKPVDFFVENSPTRGSIFNILGKRVYTVSGQLKVFNGKPYRFNYKEMCFTVKDIIRNGDSWDKGIKKIVAYDNTDLYPLLNQYNFIDQIEDLVEGPSWEDNKIRVDGKWYNYRGYYLKDADE